jgi:hypothetical protein
VSGRTGKLTTATIIARGPRMVLASGVHDDGRLLAVIFLEGESCFAAGHIDGSFTTHDKTGYIDFKTLAKSYTLSYLLRVGRCQP